MKQNVFQTALAGGVETKLPQTPQNAGRAENLTIDKTTGGWSTRIGYEPFIASPANWSPFSSTGPVYSVHCAQALAAGARQHIFYEADGNLHLVYEASGTDRVITVATNRNIPAPTEAGSWFTTTHYGPIVTNGVDRPIIVRPWPLAGYTDAINTISQCVRPFGFDGLPTPVDVRNVKVYPAPSGGSFPAPKASGNGAVTLWCPVDGIAIPDGGRWGLGFANNTGAGAADGDKEAVFGWACSFISDTGSEGPTSTLASIKWELLAGSEGFRHACAMTLPLGPPGTVARKVYRTTNYGADYVSPGDTTLYFIDVVRNNVEDTFFDAVATANLGQPAPEIATGPLPAPAARFSALFNGCLFLDGGINEPTTLFYSTVGLIEQFAADAYIELSAEGGGITALYSHYNTLLVFRENGIDVVQGDYTSGFTVTPLSNSVTCRAPHSIATVPGLGVCFLAVDGVYAVVGGLQGGAINEVINLTVPQDDIIERITPDLHAKAQGVFSEKSREYQLYVPVDGSDRPNLGLVLHVDRLQTADTLSAWTTRVGFPVGAATTLYDGTVVFGHHTGAETGGNDSQRGLFVISGKRAMGMDIVNDELVYNAAPTSAYRSAWWSAGDPQMQKQVSYVTVWVLTTGKPRITMRHYKDFSLQPTVEQTYHAQSPDATSQPVLDGAILGQGQYREERLVPLRFSVAHMSAAWFCFEIETTEDITLVGYEYEWTTKGTRVVAGVRAT